MLVVFLKELIAIGLAAFGGFLAIVFAPFDRKHDGFHWISRTYSKTVLGLFGVHVNVVGAENIRAGRPYVYVANHASLFDIPAAVSGIPDRVHIVYKKELERIPLFGWGLKYGGTYIAIDRGRGAEAAKSLEAAIQKIRDGASVLLFAEGTRTKDGKLQPFKRGAFNLAVRAGVPVVPVTINGSYRILPRHTFKVHPGAISMVIDRPIEIQTLASGRNGDMGKDMEMKLMEEVHTILEKHYLEQ